MEIESHHGSSLVVWNTHFNTQRSMLTVNSGKCHAAFQVSCVKGDHMFECPKHPNCFSMDPWDCKTCKQIADLAERARLKANEMARAMEKKVKEDDGFLTDLNNEKEAWKARIRGKTKGKSVVERNHKNPKKFGLRE